MARTIKKYIVYILCILLIITPVSIFADTKILREATSTKEQCKQWMLDRDVEQEFIDLIPYIYDTCIDIGIDPTLVVSQAALETGYFTSRTLRVCHNTAGIKERGNTYKYASYDTYKDGFEAQIKHLALYAGKPQEDYYYARRLDGWVTTIEGLAGTWAEDPHYASKILSIMDDIQDYKVEKAEVHVNKYEALKEQHVGPTTNAIDIIYSKISKNKKKSDAVSLLMRYTKRRLQDER